MKIILVFMGTVFLILCTVGSSKAVPFQNGSFELSAAAADPGDSFKTFDQFDDNTIYGWDIVSGKIDYVGTLWDASDGVRSIDMNGTTNGAISQTFDTIPLTWYEVLFDMAGNTAAPPTEKVLWVRTNPSNQQEYRFDTTGFSRPSNMGWTEMIFNFQATSNTATLIFESAISGPAGATLDNVRLNAIVSGPSTPVPEPSTLLLIGSGLVGIAIMRRKNNA